MKTDINLARKHYDIQSALCLNHDFYGPKSYYVFFYFYSLNFCSPDEACHVMRRGLLFGNKDFAKSSSDAEGVLLPRGLASGDMT
jgi:hypothetical protein